MNFSQTRSNIILILETYSLYLIRNILSNIKSYVLKRINFLFRINQKMKFSVAVLLVMSANAISLGTNSELRSKCEFTSFLNNLNLDDNITKTI